mmetsp:Transcript_58480/g.163076  ORF Transcript_58480/g.163076 Transcript_58480/m.163076 type:complete len:376 (+) Transcript_58480:89-1216(+)
MPSAEEDDSDGTENNACEWKDLMDGKIRKRVVTAGAGPSPDMQQDVLCTIEIAAALPGVERFPADADVLQRWSEKRYRIGEGEAVPVLELCLRYMQEGETCEAFGTSTMAWGNVGLRAVNPGERDIPPDTNLMFRIVLHRVLTKETMETEERLWNNKVEEATWRKHNGNDHFKRKEFGKAERCYNAAIRVFGDGLDPPEELGDGRAAAEADARKLCGDCGANLAAVYLEMGNFSGAKDVATAAIELRPENVKAVYRLAKAHLALDNFEDSEALIKRAQQLDAEDPSVKQLSLELRRKTEAYAKKSKAFGARLFAAPRVESCKEAEAPMCEPADTRGGGCSEVVKRGRFLRSVFTLSSLVVVCAVAVACFRGADAS